MTPVPLDLPLRPSEAGELASLVFDLAERQPLTAELRLRLAVRAATLRLQSLQAHCGSLARDPVHPSTYYLAVDGAQGAPLLLHMAVAAAPTSSIFPQPLLIGRMRRAGGPEIVVNAIPFDQTDTANVQKFAGSVDKAFLPRPHRAGPALVAPAGSSSFAAFQAVWKRYRKNVATVTGPYHAALWSAIRSGWREGYSAVVEFPISTDAGRQAARDAIRACPHFTGFVLHGSADDAARLSAFIRQARSAARAAPAFDLGLSLADGSNPTSPEELAAALQQLKDAGHPAQLVFPRLAERTQWAGLCAVARDFQCSLGVSAARCPEEDLRLVARQTGGRFACRTAQDGRGLESLAAALFS